MRISNASATAAAVAALCAGAIAGADSVTVTDTVDQKQACFKITTPAATYFFQKKAAGFSSLLDREGKDWISYKPGGGSAGEYRGIPNMGGCCHPGYGEGKNAAMKSTLSSASTKDKAVIVSTSTNGKWKTMWEFYATHATLTVRKVAKKYWFLYEGTPYGALDKKHDFYVNSKGTKKPVTTSSIATDLPDPEWVYFFDDRRKRSLLLVHHDNDGIKDNFWQMNGDMTVFGFGRTCKGVCMELNTTPKKFTIALVEETAYDKVKPFAESILRGDTLPGAPVPTFARVRAVRSAARIGQAAVYDPAGRPLGRNPPGHERGPALSPCGAGIRIVCVSGAAPGAVSVMIRIR